MAFAKGQGLLMLIAVAFVGLVAGDAAQTERSITIEELLKNDKAFTAFHHTWCDAGCEIVNKTVVCDKIFARLILAAKRETGVIDSLVKGHVEGQLRGPCPEDIKEETSAPATVPPSEPATEPTTKNETKPATEPPTKNETKPVTELPTNPPTTGNITSNSTTTPRPTTAVPPTTTPKPPGSTLLYWLIPLIVLILIAMALGGFYVRRYAKKTGYHRSTKTNGDTPKGASGEA